MMPVELRPIFLTLALAIAALSSPPLLPSFAWAQNAVVDLRAFVAGDDLCPGGGVLSCALMRY
jgi:hypothetical protein